MTEACWGQWEDLADQCEDDFDSDDFADAPWAWTDDCDMVFAFEEAWSIWYGEEVMAMNLKKQGEKALIRQSDKKARHAKVTALAQSKSVTTESSQFNGGVAAGTTAGVIGALGVALAIKMCSRKSVSEEDFHRV